jgi:uncharacterized coiled-coil protein SlyX
MPNPNSDRVENLEVLLSHLQKAHDELNMVVYGQQKEIDLLRQAVAKLTSNYDSLLESDRAPRTIHDDRPPHY